MTIQEKLALEEQMLVQSVEKVLARENALDAWMVTPAKPLIHKVYVVAKDDHNRLFCDEVIKRTINKVCAKKRKELRKQSKFMALQAA